jgi:hypothetical protein
MALSSPFGADPPELESLFPDPDIQGAAEFFQMKVARLWAAMRFQGHSDEKAPETTVYVEHGAKPSRVAYAKKP